MKRKVKLFWRHFLVPLVWLSTLWASSFGVASCFCVLSMEVKYVGPHPVHTTLLSSEPTGQSQRNVAEGVSAKPASSFVLCAQGCRGEPPSPPWKREVPWWKLALSQHFWGRKAGSWGSLLPQPLPHWWGKPCSPSPAPPAPSPPCVVHHILHGSYLQALSLSSMKNKWEAFLSPPFSWHLEKD